MSQFERRWLALEEVLVGDILVGAYKTGVAQPRFPAGPQAVEICIKSRPHKKDRWYVTWRNLATGQLRLQAGRKGSRFHGTFMTTFLITEVDLLLTEQKQ